LAALGAGAGQYPNFVNFVSVLHSFTDAPVKWFSTTFPCLPIVLVLFLFTALPEDQVQAFCTSARHRTVIPCDSTAFLFHSSPQSPYTLQWATPSPVKITPSRKGSGPHLMHGSLSPPEPTTQTASGSVHPFCKAHDCERQTDRPTDRQTTLFGL